MPDLVAGRYSPQGLLGEGTGSPVLLVRDLHRDGRLLALKHLPAGESHRALAEFQRLCSFDHPSIPKAHEFAFDPTAGACYFTTDAVDGRDFLSVLRDAPLDDHLEALAQLLRVLQLVHDRELLHRDLKPANVLVRRQGDELQVVLIDFGLADAAAERRLQGSLAYMAPELFDGQQATAATDLYAVGVMLFELWTGALPFQAEDLLGWIRAHREAEVRFPEEGHVPPSLGRLVLRLLAKDPEGRYPSARAVLRDLSRLSVQSLPLETSASLRGRVRSPPRPPVLDPGAEASPGEASLQWAVSSSSEARAKLARELRSAQATRGRVVLRWPMDESDLVPAIAGQVRDVFGGPVPEDLEALLRRLAGEPVALWLDGFDRRRVEREAQLRRLNYARLPLLVCSADEPQDDSFGRECRGASRSIEIHRPHRWTRDEVRERFPSWVGMACPAALDELLDPADCEIEHVVDLLCLLIDQGAVEPAGNELRLHGGRVQLAAHTDRSEIVGRRIALLSSAPRRLLQLLAARDAPAAWRELESMEGAAAPPETLDVLRAQAFVESLDGRAGRSWRVAGSLVRDAALALCTDEERRALHRSWAVLLQSSTGEGEGEDWAWQSLLGAMEGAAAAAARAGQRLLDAGRFEDALRFAERALESPEAQGGLRARLCLVAGSARLKEGASSGAVDDLREGLEHADEAQLVESLRLELSRALERGGEFEEALEGVAEDGGTASGPALAQRAFLLYRLRRFEEAERALRAADSSLGTEASKDRVRVHNTFGLLLFETGRGDEARGQFRRAIELAGAAGNPIWQASAEHNLARVEDDAGQLEEARALFSRSQRVAERYGDRQMSAVFATSEAQSLLDLGRTEEAGEVLDRVRGLLEAAGLGPQFRRPVATLQSLVALSEGELEAALDSARRSRDLGVEQGDPLGIALADLVRIEILVRRGDEGAARAALDELKVPTVGAQAAVVAEYLEARRLLVASWFGDDEERALLLSAAPPVSTSIKRGADLAEARVRCAIACGRLPQAVAEAKEALQRLAGSDLRGARVLLEVAIHVGEGGREAGPTRAVSVRRAVDTLVAPGMRSRRAEALWWLGMAHEDPALLAEARTLATACRHAPLLAELERARVRFPESSGDPETMRRLRSLERLKEVTKTINREMDGERLLRMVLDHAIEHTGAKRGFLILLRGDSISIPAARNIDASDIQNPEFAVSSSVARSVARDGEAYLASDARTDQRFGAATSIAQLRLQSILCVPLRGGEDIAGAMYLDDPTRIDGFDEHDLGYVEDLSDYAVIALEKARLLRTNLERQRELEARRREIERLNQRLESKVEQQAKELVEVRESLRATRAELSLKYEYPEVVTRSKSMRKMLSLIDRITDSMYPVYLFGESGTGKELIARCLHVNGPRAQGPYFSMNCGSFSPTLIETELFGHVRGAFTGADRDKPGVFELADGGILFLDEVSDSSLELQSKLLRATQFGEVLRVGSDEVRRVDVRVISASNRDLADEVEAGRFREDLYYRLNVHRVELPPLRERPEDVPLLIEHFQDKHATELGVERLRFERAALDRLMDHAWRGNVRELENVVIDLLVRCSDSGAVTVDRLPNRLRLEESPPGPEILEGGLKASVEAHERALIELALKRCKGVRSQAARSLGMSERNLYKKLAKYGLMGRGAL